MRRNWGAFAGKLFFSLFVVWIAASMVLWFFYPTTIFEIWRWTMVSIICAMELLFIVSLAIMAVDGIRKLIKNGWFRKVFALPKKYVLWLTKELRQGDDDDQHS